jgi:SanA protein
VFKASTFSRNWRNILKCLALGLLAAGLSVVLLIFGCSWWVTSSSQAQLHTIEQLPTASTQVTGILLGAKVYANGGLAPMMQDRADTAIDLYNQKKITTILVSGDHGTKTYDEVNTIKNYLLEHGIPAENIFMDHAGFDTYDSLYRARDIFQVKEAVIVSQKFHLPRALFIANKLGVSSQGVIADRAVYPGLKRNYLRERLASVKAVLDIVLGTRPRFLGEVIPITGDSKKSWD